MEAFRLKSMTDFVLEQNEKIKKYKYGIESYYSTMQVSINYANFLKQTLKLEMFVPCDEDGNVLEEPKIEEEYVDEHTTQIFAQYQYDLDKAKEKVLFEGIEFRKNGGVNFLTIKEDTFAFFDFNVKFKNLTIEYLIQYDLQLTENAVKQIGL